MRKKVCISGYYGFDNFGDETILKVLTENLRDFDVTVFSSNPLKTSSMYGVKSVKSFDIPQVIKSLCECDCLISGGGSLLQDSTSIKSLVYYLFVIIIAQLAGKKTIVFAQGIGPIRNSAAAQITFYILKKAAYISVRDKNSLELLRNHGVKAELCNDPVWNIAPQTKTLTNILGVQLRSFPLLTDDILKTAAHCICKNYAHKAINIFSLQNKLDIEVCEKLQEYIKEINSKVKVEVIQNTSNEKLINDIAQADELIAMRYHACLIAVKNKIKLLPVSYDIKVETLAKRFGLEYIDLNVNQDIESIVDNFAAAEILYNGDEIDRLQYDFSKLKDVINA